LELAGSTIAVTGATGFLGRYIVDVLADRGARVVGVVRNPARAPELPERGVELRRADLAEPEALAAAFAGADAAVSNAALFSLRKYRAGLYREANLQGTRNVFDALARAGVRRAVHVSSVVGYRGQAREPLGENHPQYDGSSGRRPWNAYAISKALSEQEAWRLARRHGIGLTCVRPSGIYGAFDTNFMPVHKALAAVLPIGAYPVFMRLPMVYAGDVATAIGLVLEKDVSIGKAYNVAGENRMAWDFLRAWREAGGKSPWLVIPFPLPSRRRFSSRRAEQELGWRNRPLVDGLRETLAAEAAGPAARRIGIVSAT
jgi:nucleoside-diphosphate-sugar epimerase